MGSPVTVLATYRQGKEARFLRPTHLSRLLGSASSRTRRFSGPTSRHQASGGASVFTAPSYAPLFSTGTHSWP